MSLIEWYWLVYCTRENNNNSIIIIIVIIIIIIMIIIIIIVSVMNDWSWRSKDRLKRVFSPDASQPQNTPFSPSSNSSSLICWCLNHLARSSASEFRPSYVALAVSNSRLSLLGFIDDRSRSIFAVDWHKPINTSVLQNGAIDDVVGIISAMVVWRRASVSRSVDALPIYAANWIYTRADR